MGIQRALEFCGGAVAVYLAMVACSGAPKSVSGGEAGATSPVASAGQAGELVAAAGQMGSSAGGQGGELSAAGGDTGGLGLAGMFTDPTPDAGATEAGAGPGPSCECPEPPVVPEEVVWEEYEVDCVAEAGASVRFAILELPEGVSESRKARSVVVMNGVPEAQGRVGLTSFAAPPLIGATMIAMQCVHSEVTAAKFLVPSR